AAVLRQPEMVGSVLALLGEERDVVRNEALLLVARLAEGSADLQNILAFQGTNELLLSIIEAEKEENGIGSVIVHDCLQIINTLVSGNLPACRIFAESGCLPRLVPLLPLPPSFTKGEAGSVQRVCELIAMMLACARGQQSDLKGMQATLFTLEVPSLLLNHLTDPVTSTEPSLRLHSLCTVGECVRAHRESADLLLAASARRRQGEEWIEEPALPRLLHVALRSSSAVWHASTARLFSCLLEELPHAQQALSASLHTSLSSPSSSAHSTSASSSSSLSVGVMAVNALLNHASGEGEGGGQAWLASCVLGSLFYSNPEVQTLALSLPSPLPSPQSQTGGGSLMNRCVRLMFSSLRGGHAPLLQLALIRLLAGWVWRCEAAAAAFCAPTASLPSLIDALAQQGLDPHVRGHLAALLGACIISSPEEGGGESSTSDSLPRVASEPCMSTHSLTCLPSPPGRELLISMVTRRLGLGPYEEAWEGMVASGPFAQADQLWRASDADARAHAACPFPHTHSDPSRDEQCNALQLEAESLRNRLAAAEAAEGQLAGLREEVERMRAERDGRGAQVNSATRLLLDAAFEQSLREGWGSV
ncbi:MAG: hypothetical protein SGPRY_003640, partial [Prymnesium sp.]